MPLKLLGSTRLLTDATSILYGATPFSMSFWMRLDRADQTYTGSYVLFNSPQGGENHTHIDLNTWGVDFWIKTFNPSTQENYTPHYTAIVPPTIGLAYHVVMVVGDGTFKVYVNGVSAISETVVGSEGVYGDSGPYTLSLGCYADVDFTLQDVAIWTNYTLTQSDAIALRDRSSVPTDIGGSDLKWWIPLTGDEGTAPTVGDDSLTDLSSSGLDITSIPNGSPTYDPVPLTFSFSSEVASARVTPDRKGVVVVFQDTDGNIVNVVGSSKASANPTLTTQSLNSGAAFELTTPIYGITGTYLPFIYYPLADPIGETDTPVLNSVDMWISTTAGAVETLNDFPVDNTARTTLLPAFVPNQKTMDVGYNIGAAPNYYATVPMYANVAKQIEGFAGTYTLNEYGYPVTIGGAGSINAIVSEPVTDLTTSTKETYNAPASGTWTLMWDGPGTDPGTEDPIISLYDSSSRSTVSVLSSDVAAIGQTQSDNTVQYSIALPNQDTYWSVRVDIRATVPGFSNLRVYPPGVATDGSDHFHPLYLEKLNGVKCLRFMSPIDNVGGSGGGMITDYADFTPVDMLGYSQLVRSPGGNVASVGPYTDTENFFGDTATALITFSAAHNYKEGNSCSPNIPGPNVNLSFDLTGGATGWLIPPIGEGFNALVRIVDSTHLAMPMRFASGSGQCTLAATHTAPGTPGAGEWVTGYLTQPALGVYDLDKIVPGLPPTEAVDLCNAVGADIWLNIPNAVTEDCVTELFTMVGERLSPGHKVYVEYSNEIWNSGFTGQVYCDAMYRVQGLSNKFQFYAKHSAEIHDWAAAALGISNRGGDLVRVFGVQGGSPGQTTTEIINYAAVQTPKIKIDAFAVAPYFENAPNGYYNTESSLVDTYDSLGTEQIMDLGELFMQYGGYETYITGHYAVFAPSVNPKYPDAKVVCYEGGPQYGLPGSNLPNGAWTEREHIWARHPRMRGIMLWFLQSLQDSGCTLFNDFMVSSGDQFKRGVNWNTYYTWNMKAGTGDGSDGQYDNRLDFENYGELVSVVGGAINYWVSLSEVAPPAILEPGATFTVTLDVSTAGTYTRGITASAGNVVIKNAPGILDRIIVTTANSTSNVIFYDSATTNSGTIIGVIPSTAVAGQIYQVSMPAAHGITVANNATCAFTVSYL